jgi:hypothetical protein
MGILKLGPCYEKFAIALKVSPLFIFSPHPPHSLHILITSFPILFLDISPLSNTFRFFSRSEDGDREKGKM